MKEELSNIRNQAIGEVTEVSDKESLERVRTRYLGRKGKIKKLTSNLSELTIKEKKELGPLINELKKSISEIIGQKEAELNKKTSDGKKWFDPSYPGKKYKIGHKHPTTLVIDEMMKIFSHMGFSRMEGPEIESETYNFEKLNLPADHPARSLQDALYLKEPEVVLRTHTSSVEARVLEKVKPPFRVVVAGKCFRYENVNASNNAMFYQFQGFALQKGLSMADLKGTLYYFVNEFYGKDREIRFRCKYYPEVEPGVGLDLDCPFCNKKGCSVCKGRGWLEILGAGMIHPNMLRQNGYDPKEINGFAFGMGLDRIVMDRFKITDVRSLYNGDIKY